MPDFNGWGFNSQPQQDEQQDANAYEGNTYANEQEASDTSTDTVTEQEQTATAVEPDETETERDGKKTRAKGNGSRRSGEKKFPHIEEQFGKKLIPLVKALDDEHVIALAKVLGDTKKTTPEAVLDALTEKSSQKRIAEFSDMVEGLATAEPGMVRSEVTLVLAQGKDATKLLFDVLNAVAPERNFGRPVDDQSPAGMRKNVARIADNWGDGVDLSPVELLKL